MSNQNNNTASTVAIPLPKNKKNLVIIGCCALMFYLAANGGAVAINQTYFLTRMNQMEQFALTGILISIGTAIMTPIGGKLGEIFGRKKLVMVTLAICLVMDILVAYSQNFPMYAGALLVSSLAKGAFLSVPYIIANLVNERKDVPKTMGYLASCVAVGGFAGAFVAGWFNDRAMASIGHLIPLVAAALAFVCLATSFPNSTSKNKPKLDITGILIMVIMISTFVATFNFAPKIGWTSPVVLAGFVVIIASIYIFYKFEKSVEENGGDPIVAMRLFKNKEYTALLIVGLICYFYQTPMMNYGPMAILRVLGGSATVASTLTLPRTILTIILPTLTGIWVGKKKTNSWKAMALGSGIVAVALIPLVFISPSMNVIVFLVAFGITGIAESFRSVSITPAAQETLDPKDISTGTALVNFMNTLSGVLAATLSGVLFNSAGENVQSGLSSVFLSSVLVSAVGLLIVIFYIRKKQQERFADN